MNNYFPVKASILSNTALCDKLKSEYLFQNEITCNFYIRSINDIYIIRDGPNKYYYKIYNSGLKTYKEIDAELFLINSLKENNIQVVNPVLKRDKSYITEFNTVEGQRFGVLYNEVKGKIFENNEITDLMNENFGLYIASIHKTWDKIPQHINRWNLDITTFIDKSIEYLMRYADLYTFDYEFLNCVAKETKTKIENSFPKESPIYGLCHGDIYVGNAFFDSNNPILFDFDFSGYSWRAYDISMHLSCFGWGIDPEAIEKRKRRKEIFLNGYLKIRNLSDLEINSIYLFTPFRRIFNIGSIYALFADSYGHKYFENNVNEDIRLLKDWLKVYKIF